MNITNCKLCNKPMVRKGKRLCSSCEELEMKTILHIRDYVDRNPLASLDEVASSLGLAKTYVKKLQVEGRVKIKDNCQSCGKLISVDRWCKECKKKLTKELSSREKSEELLNPNDVLSLKERLALEDRICIDKVSQIEKEKHERMYGRRRYGFGVKRYD